MCARHTLTAVVRTGRGTLAFLFDFLGARRQPRVRAGACFVPCIYCVLRVAHVRRHSAVVRGRSVRRHVQGTRCTRQARHRDSRRRAACVSALDVSAGDLPLPECLLSYFSGGYFPVNRSCVPYPSSCRRRAHVCSAPSCATVL